MSKAVGFVILFLTLVVLGLIINGNILGNMLLGMISAVIALVGKRGKRAVSLVGSASIGVLFVPYFAYLVWYAVIGVRVVTAEVATGYLLNYVNEHFFSSIPSTIAGAIGGMIVDSID